VAASPPRTSAKSRSPKAKRTKRTRAPNTKPPDWSAGLPCLFFAFESRTPRPVNLSDADLKRLAKEFRVPALEFVLNADIPDVADLAALMGLARTLLDRYRHGFGCHDEDWAEFADDLRAVQRYAREGAARPEDAQRLCDLGQLAEPSRKWLPWRPREGSADPPVPIVSFEVPGQHGARLLAGQVFLTAQALARYGLLPARRCEYPRCQRWFVPLGSDKRHCCAQCRKDAHAVREGYRSKRGFETPVG
jgi:hypothetical protein